MKQKIKFINTDKTRFFITLKERVDQYFIDNKISPHANFAMVFKTIVMLSLYFVPYILIMTQHFSPLLMWLSSMVMGLGLAGIGMGVMHDSNHGAYSPHPYLNRIISLSLTLVGGDNKNWKMQHNILHHTYTNIYGHDRDIDDKVVMRFAPQGKYWKVQRFQVVYVFFFYSIMSLYWTTAKDFIQYIEFIKQGHNRESTAGKIRTFVTIVFWKLIYYTYIFVLPMLLLHLSFGQVFIGFISLHLVAGIILSVIFQLAHVVENTIFPMPDEKGNIQNEWAIHQMQTTADFCRHNWFITYFVGGLNFQAIHHLFPNICHIHYPKLAPIVEQTAKEFGIPYLYNQSFWGALASHLRIISSLGKKDLTFMKVANSMG